MKLLHLGDLHLGRTLGQFDLADDQRFILDQILDIIRREAIDAVLVAGDVYDRALPSESATNLLDHFLSSLAAMEVKTFVISGNHDSDDRLNYGSRLFRSGGIFIHSRFEGILESHTLKDRFGPVCIWLLPFVKASQVRYFFPEEEIRSYEDAVRAILRHAPIDPSVRNVLVAHQFVAGAGRDPELGGSESAGTQSVGLVEKISCSCFDDFDYVALGHIHSAQQVGREEVRYCGSPLKYSVSEALHDKSVPIVTLEEKGDVHISLHPLQPRRDLRHIWGPMEKLLARENLQDTDDYIYATLTDEQINTDAMTIMQQTYPNTVRIDYDNSHTRKILSPDRAAPAPDQSFEELISDFYSRIYGCPITEEELQIMQQTAKEAGIL